jgi:hypothetical protein
MSRSRSAARQAKVASFPRYFEGKRVKAMLPGSLIATQDPASWGVHKNLLPDPNTDPVGKTPWELDRIADAILWRDIDGGRGRANFQHPVILMYEHLMDRRAREIYAKDGLIDPTLTRLLSPDGHMLYNRTKPNGRKHSTLEERKKGFSYYK